MAGKNQRHSQIFPDCLFNGVTQENNAISTGFGTSHEGTKCGQSEEDTHPSFGKAWKKIVSLHALGAQTLIQHDNGPQHTSKATAVFLRKNRVKVILLASISADFNPMGTCGQFWKDRLSIIIHPTSRFCKSSFSKNGERCGVTSSTCSFHI